MSMRKLRLLVLVLTVSSLVLAGCAQSGGIKTLTEENFKTLLTVEDVQWVLISEVPLKTEFYDYKAMAESVDPDQVVGMDSFYGLSFQTEDGMKAITLTAMDLDSQASAQNHFEEVKAENADAIGGIVVFIKGDKVVQLHTAQPDDEQPLTSLEGLKNLAQIVEEKLQ